MATKTISLELDAYERLKRAKRGKESFSAVVRRARFDAPKSSGSAILAETAALYHAKKGASAKTLDYWDKAEATDREVPRVSPSKWDDEA
ncbi:antitoxin VapB family protein [Coraliomargarita parva]|uniref:antitoxin VapB family protein n=1 Tax=Coraliomargarita parva TaxID=3014050 RepID=UPI0022B508A0|nr:antitoxin VapB family protein [Coraliomargarita parva]